MSDFGGPGAGAMGRSRMQAQAEQRRAGYPVDDENPNQLTAPGGSMTIENDNVKKALGYNLELCSELLQELAILNQHLNQAGFTTSDASAQPPDKLGMSGGAVATAEPPPVSGIASQFRAIRNDIAESNARIQAITLFVRRVRNSIDA